MSGVGGKLRLAELLEVDALEALPIHAVEKIEVVRLERSIPELRAPVALEIGEPAQSQVRVHQPPVDAGSDERAEAVESGQARQASEEPQTIAARARSGPRAPARPPAT